MKWLWFLLAGTLGGVLAGMGMGGGTLTIPLLVLALGTEQTTAQFINLLAFLPAGFVALAVHLKNRLVVFKDMQFILLPAIVTAVASAFFATDTGGDLLAKLFGGFLIAVALLSLTADLVKKS